MIDPTVDLTQFWKTLFASRKSWDFNPFIPEINDESVFYSRFLHFSHDFLAQSHFINGIVTTK